MKSVFLFCVRPRQRHRCVDHFFAASLLRPLTSDCVGVRALKANQRVRFKVNSESQSLRTMPMRHCKLLPIFFNPFAAGGSYAQRAIVAVRRHQLQPDLRFKRNAYLSAPAPRQRRPRIDNRFMTTNPARSRRTRRRRPRHLTASQRRLIKSRELLADVDGSKTSDAAFRVEPSAAGAICATRFLGAVHTPCSRWDDGDPRDHVCGPFLCRLLGADAGVTG
jgi:hypothetical protein